MKLWIVGIGPGGPFELTPRARAAIEESAVVAGYSLYLGFLRPLLAGKELISTGMRGEAERCRAAVRAARSGKVTAIVSGGDAGVYGMAGLALELAAPYPELEIEIVPGVTAACAAAAALGAPLGHDFAVISLSDLLTERALIEKRLRLAAEGDFVLCLYNPMSRTRPDTLRRACGILLGARGPETLCGMVRNAGREGQQVRVLTLGELGGARADMLTTVIVGSSKTRLVEGRLVTPRGYDTGREAQP